LPQESTAPVISNELQLHLPAAVITGNNVTVEKKILVTIILTWKITA
jgi:hypothetical protein